MATPLDLIRDKERFLREQLLNLEVTELDLPRSFFYEQIGLRPVMIDQLGRLWDVSGNPIRMICDPYSLSRTKEK